MMLKKTKKDTDEIKTIKGFKGFNPDWTCTPNKGVCKQYKPGETYSEDKASLCNAGLHFVENPADLFDYYSPVGNNGQLNKFAVVTADGVSDEYLSDSKRVCQKLTIGAELSFAALAKARIKYVKEHTTEEHTDPKLATAGDRGAAIAGDRGAATAGHRGAAIAGDDGAATAGHRGAAIAGDDGAATAGYAGAAIAGYGGAATAGYAGAAIAGHRGAATAGYGGAATAGDDGAATSRGSVSVGKNGCALARGNNVRAKGGLGAILVLCEENNNDNDIKDWKVFVVDGEDIKADTWYCLNVDGEVIEAGKEGAE